MLNPTLEQREKQCGAVLENLLAAPALALEKALEKKLPNAQGLYAIARNGAPDGEYLHAGKTRSAGLRARIWTQHCNGGGKGAGSDLLQKVIDRGHATNRQQARIWIEQNCTVQWIILEDNTLRGWAEHYVVSVLQPIWGA